MPITGDTPFLDFQVLATGTNVARTMPDRLSEVVNVKDYGAIGDESVDDRPAIQRALNAAFTNATEASNYTTAPGGGAPVPNGVNSELNRPVYIPPGRYQCNTALNLTDIQGGVIYGDGPQASVIRHLANGLVIDGCAHTAFRGLTFHGSGVSLSSGQVGLYLDWTGTGSIGLHDVLFFNVTAIDGHFSGKINPSAVADAGKGLTFVGGGASGSGVGWEISGDAIVNFIGTNASSCTTGVHIKDNASLTNNGMQGAGISPAQTDFQHDSTGTLVLYGGRSESSHLLNITNGKAVIDCIGHATNGENGWAITCMSPATVNITSSTFGVGASDENGAIKGDGDVFLKNTSFLTSATTSPIYLVDFIGRICQYVGANTFTVAQLPPAAVGLILPISNSSTVTWGATISAASPGSPVLGRYNGSVWKVMGV